MKKRNIQNTIYKILRRLKPRTYIALSLIFILFPIILISLYKPSDSSAEWMDASYAYRQKFTFTHNADIAAERSITLSLDTAELIAAGVMQSDCDDTRFTGVDGAVLLYDLTGTCDNAATTYEVIFPEIFNDVNAAYVYYGHPSAANAEIDSTGYTALTPFGGDPSITNRTNEEDGPNPAGYWKFDEGVDNTCTSGGTDDACDESSNSNDATMTGGTWQPEDMCKIGKCMFFDGSDDVATITNANAIDFDLGLSSGVTFETWVRVNSDGESNVGEILDKDGGAVTPVTYIRTTNEGSDGLADLEVSLDLATTNATKTVTNGIILNRWQHIAMTYADDADDEITVYIDGVSQGTSTDGSGAPTGTDTNNLLIGGSSGANFHGFIDDFIVYDEERTAAEIKVDYNSGSTSFKEQYQDTLSDGLVGYWPMDETSTDTCPTAGADACDKSGNNLDGTASGLTFGNDMGIFGPGVWFDGTDDHISVADNSTLEPSTLTVSAWVDPVSPSASDIILTKRYASAADPWDSYLMRIQSNTYDFCISSTSAGSTTCVNSTTATESEWHLITATYDGATLKLFVDGVEEDSTSTSLTIGYSSLALQMGEWETGWDYHGTIDDVRIYNRALSPGEISDLYNFAPGPIAHYKLDENPPLTQAGGGGMLAFADSSGDNDILQYRILDADGNWEAAAANTADIDSGSTNKRGQNTYLYASPTKDEYILLSTHYISSNIYQYGQVYDGDTGTWGNVQLLDTWNTSDTISRKVMDGDYLASGRFMAVTTDGSNTPQFSIWDGSSWSTISSPTQDIGGSPSFIRVEARPGTDEVMIAIHDNSRDTNTIYYDGAGTATTDFTLHTEHAIISDSQYDGNLDFVWSQNSPTRGFFVYNFSSTESHEINIFTANGSGGGSWGTADNTINTGDEASGVRAADRPGTDEFIWCHKDAVDSPPEIYCLEENDGDTTPTEKEVTNGSPLAAETDTDDIKPPFDVGYEQNAADQAIIVYSDGTASTIPKLKKYDPSSGTNGTWDAGATSLGDLSQSVEFVEIFPEPGGDDMAIVMRDSGLDVSTVFWDGASDAVYSSGDRAQTEQETTSGQYSRNQSITFAWNLQAGAGTTAYDTSTNANNGTLEDTMTTADWVPGRYGTALDFDGSGDAVTVATASDADIDFNANQAFTLSAWVYVTTMPGSGNQDAIITKWDETNDLEGYRLIVENDDADSTGNFEVEIWDDSANQAITASGANDTVSENTWYHVTATFNGGQAGAADDLKLYTNGILTDGNSANASFLGLEDVASDFVIGEYDTDDAVANNTAFNGYIDDVQIHNYVRTTGQIVQTMNADHPAPGSPIGSQTIYYKFDEQYGTTANDSIGNQNGTVDSNLTWLTNASCKVNGCLKWDTAGEEVSIATASDADVDFNGNEAFSGSAWVYITTMPGSSNQDAIIAKWDGTTAGTDAYRLVVENDDADTTGNFQVEVMDASASQSITASTANDLVSVNTWYHVGFTFNGGTAGAADDLKLYIDGIERASNSANASFLGLEDVSADFTIGEYDATDAVANNTAFTGYIDEIKIYNSTLTAAQMKIDSNFGAVQSFSTGQNEAADLTDGAGNAPVGHWSMDENTGSNANDISGNGNTGTLISGPTWATGKYGSAVSFDGANDDIDVGVISASNNFTLSTWVKTSASGVHGILSKYDNNGEYTYAIYQDSSNKPVVQIGDDATNCAETTGTTSINTGEWIHIAATYDQQNLKLYVNGQLETTNPQSFTLGDTNYYHNLIGDVSYQSATDWYGGGNLCSMPTSGSPFDGLIDQVKIYNYARTPAQIAYDYNRGKPVGHWKFDECQGATANDASGNSNNGTITIGATGSNTSAGTCGSGTGTEAWNNGTTGKLNYSLDFDGTDDVVTVTNASEIDFDEALQNEVTFTAWIYANSDGEGSVGEIFDKGATTFCRTDTESGSSMDLQCSLDLATTDATLNISAPISTNTWHHIAMTYADDADDEITIYVDGVSLGSSTDGDGAPASTDTNNLLIGGSSTANFDGQIDDFRIYNYELSATQIKKVMNDDAGTRFGPSSGSP